MAYPRGMKSVAKLRYHHGALEQALVDEAVRQVRERGTDQVSLRGLAQIIGVSPSAAYQHFPDKAALLMAVRQKGFEELSGRMMSAVEEITAEADAGAVGRFLAVGNTYVEFAVAEPHLFRHMFGAASAKGSQFTHPEDYTDARWKEGGPDPYDILLARLAELSERQLLRPGLNGDGLDVLGWSLVHGFSSLVVDGMLPLEAGEPLLMLFGRLVLTDDAYATFSDAVAAQAAAAPTVEVADAPVVEVADAAGGR
jgi:AcrR family transcriptional regulator